MLNRDCDIWDGVHSGRVHSGLRPFGIVSIRDHIHWGWCVHSGLCPFRIVSIRNGVSIRDGAHLGWCPFGMMSIKSGAIRDRVQRRRCVRSGLGPFRIEFIRDGVSIRDAEPIRDGVRLGNFTDTQDLMLFVPCDKVQHYSIS